MSDSSHDEIRQIKWILLGMLGCLVVIALSLAPALIEPFALVAIVGAVAALLWVLSRSARQILVEFWSELSGLWRRR